MQNPFRPHPHTQKKELLDKRRKGERENMEPLILVVVSEEQVNAQKQVIIIVIAFVFTYMRKGLHKKPDTHKLLARYSSWITHESRL